MEARKVLVGGIHWTAALHLVTEVVAVAAGKQPTGPVKLGDVSAAMHPIGVDVADKPGALPAEPAGRPEDRHALVNAVPFVVASSDTVMKDDGCPFTDDLNGRGCVVPVVPLPGTELPTGEISLRAPALSHSSDLLPSTVPVPFQLWPPRGMGFCLPKSLG